MKTQYTYQTDDALLQAYRATGNAATLGVLLQRYTVLLLGVCMKYLKQLPDAQDAVQQVCEKTIIEINKAYEIDNFGGWLYRIAVNHCLTTLRQAPRSVNEEILQWLAADDETTDDAHWQKVQNVNALKAELQFIKPEQQVCIKLFYFENKSYNEIAEEINIDVKSVKSYIQNGKRNLRLRLENKISL